MKIVGHKKILAYLSKTSSAKTISHAYLFYGPEHVGKSTVARWFGKMLVCEKSCGAPCEMCRACVEIEKGIYPDFHNIQAGSHTSLISIDEIRTLKLALSHTSLHNSYKIVIIDPIEALGPEAANAILKTLEEPHGKTVFILIANVLTGIAKTIISRTELITFSNVSRAEIIKALPETYSSEQKEFIARITTGKIALALSLTPEIIHERAKDEREILKLLTSPLHEQIVLTPKTIERLGEKTREYTASLLRDILLYKIGGKKYVIHRYLARELYDLGKKIRLSAVTGALNELLAMTSDIRHNVNEELLWSTILLKLSSKDAPSLSQFGY